MNVLSIARVLAYFWNHALQAQSRHKLCAMGAEYATNIEDRARGYCFAAEMTVVKIAEGYRDKVALLPSTAGVFEEDGSIMGQGSQFWKAVGSSGMLLTAIVA